jgi:ABC-type glycerol-3-phosphate transport system substrate-binding protein
MAAGNAADVAVINVPSAWPLMYRKQLVNLTDAFKADTDWQEYITHFVPITLTEYTYKDALWAVPFSLETSGTIYNEDLLTKAGVKLPHEYSETEWTWDAFVQTATAATSGEGTDKIWGCNMSAEWQSGLGDLVVSNGGDLLAADGLSTRITEDSFVNAAQLCVDMVLKNKISNSAQALSTNQLNNYSAFINQKIAMMVSGDWAFGWVINNQLPDQQFKLNWWTSPVSPTLKMVEGIGHSTGFYAWTGTQHLPETLAFVKFLASKEAQNLVTENYKKSPILSPRTDCQDAFWNLNLVPNATALKDAYDKAVTYPHTPLINASVAIGYINTDLTALQNGTDTRSVKDVLVADDKQIMTDLQKGAQG